MKKNTYNRGISMIELIVYFGILAVISVFVVNTLVLITKTIGRAKVERALTSNGELIMQKIIREARLASSFNGSTTFSVTPGALSLTTIVSPAYYATTTADFYTIASGQLYFKKATATPILLNSDDVSITSLIFRRISTASSTFGVKIEMTLQATTTPLSNSSRNFYGTAMFRGSY